jgi:hypothetical protein
LASFTPTLTSKSETRFDVRLQELSVESVDLEERLESVAQTKIDGNEKMGIM